MSMRRLCYFLSCIAYGLGLVLLGLVVRCPAQTPVPRSAASAEEAALRQAEGRAAAQAHHWARGKALPTRIRQATGSWIQLVAFEETGPVYLASHNEAAAQTTRTDQLHPGGALGLDLSGRGLTLGLWDGGLALPGHQEFGGRVQAHDPADVADHATHIAGTLIAAGVEPGARGMAYEAELHTRDWHLDTAELAEVAQESGLLVSSHPYGPLLGWHFGDLEQTGSRWYWLGDRGSSLQEDIDFGRYSADARRWDEATWHNPYVLPVVSAGNDRDDQGPTTGPYRALDPATDNYRTYTVEEHPIPPDGQTDGYDTLGSLAVAKNTLAVGGLARRTGPGSAARPSAFSAFGPTDDGRIKPDLVADGAGLFSSFATGPAAYERLSGTSMASANVAGSLLLLQQYHAQITGRKMRAASLKGLALHTAEDLGPPGPDYQFGWGLFDAAAAAQHLSDLFAGAHVLVEQTLHPATPVYTAPLQIDRRGPVRLTLAWTDPPAEVLQPARLDESAPRLVYDLDLRLVQASTGNVFTPFVLDPARPARLATTGDNVRDVVEQIFLPDAEPGTYTLVVQGKQPPQIPQSFTLLVSGAAGGAPVPVTAFRRTLTPPGVAFQWQTVREAEAGVFLLERAQRPSSAAETDPDLSYQGIGEVALQGGAAAGAAYAMTDTGVPYGAYAYRLIHQSPAGERRTVAATRIEVPLALVEPLVAETRPAQADLSWTVTAAYGSGTFEVHRVARDGVGADTVLVGETLPLTGPYAVDVAYRIEDRHVTPGRYRYLLDLYTEDHVRVAHQETEVEIISPVVETLVAYPNPCSDRVHVALYTPVRSRISVAVYDALGRQMIRLVDNDWVPVSWHTYTVHTQHWPPGLYLVRVTSAEGTTRTLPLVCLP